jgi:hypothetical protein
MKEQPKPGEKVKFTGKFLACTGQQTGDEGAKVFTVQECSCTLCKSGKFVQVNEKAAELGFFAAEELEAMPHLRWRHIAIANLMPAYGPKALRAEYFEIPVTGRTL